MFADHISGKGPIFRIYKEPQKLNSNNKTNNLTIKWAKDIDISLTRTYEWQISTHKDTQLH